MSVNMNIDLNGKTALITGATRGIGKAVADEFLRGGAQVILTGTKPADIEQFVAANENPHIKWYVADFSTQEGIDLFINELKNINPIDICINNAGINIIKSFGEYSVAEYQRLLSINLKAPFMLVQHIVPGMKKRGYGRIVNIASIWSHITKPERSLYTMSKTGLVGFTRSIAIEYASSNILVNAVSPGFTMTELTEQSLSADEINDLSGQIPLGRFANPAEIAKTVLFLASELNTYITGQNIIIDGGFTLV